ncbi:hypothetical protein QAD02_001074 [Eretmocerus hayati]|uniref:Uncharacterized protein n=1 Tax=Eretmocerus hayati TaxID=131215 RepID=A0ACC2NF84_9HYME|nr:hypothetical protein QAD02_001074 [Eretmocerus hayati]
MNNNSVEKPDPDNIKMFVGQVPKDLDENDLRTIFEEFGRVHQINVLRDKYTGSSKGTARLFIPFNQSSSKSICLLLNPSFQCSGIEASKAWDVRRTRRANNHGTLGKERRISELHKWDLKLLLGDYRTIAD